MGTEIERKYLVNGDEWRVADSQFYCQGYLNRDANRTVRIRIAGNEAWLTVKSITTNMTRAEFEYSITLADAEQMLQLCEAPLIEKRRYVVDYEGMSWEVDEFLGENEGLVVAEIELESETQPFQTPPWIGEEVTDDPRYFNSRLSIAPYKSW